MFFGLFNGAKKKTQAAKKKKKKKRTTVVNPDIERQLAAARKRVKEAEDKHDQCQEEIGAATDRLYRETIDLSGSSLQQLLEGPSAQGS